MNALADWCAEHMAKPSVADAIPMPRAVRDALDELKALTERLERAAAVIEGERHQRRRECGITQSDMDATG
jgi:hypothetical protein